MATDPGQEARGSTQSQIPSPEDVIEGASDYERSAERLVELYPARRRSVRNVEPARALGFLSIGLGLAALLAPKAVGRMTGLSEHTGLLRLVGAREIASGAGLLTQKEQPVPWLWSRVAGDAMDLALLGTALRPSNPHRGRAMGALAVVAAIAAVDVAASLQETRRKASPGARVQGRSREEPFVEHSVSVDRSAQECYAFWRDFSNHPRFSRTLESVTQLDDRHSHWVMRGPAGTKVEWDAEVTVDRPGDRLAWHSLEGSRVAHAGVVRFEKAAGGRGTVVRVLMHYRPPAGRLGAALAKLSMRDPDREVREDLRRFKSLIETGEIPTTRGQPSGRRSMLGRMTRDGRESNEGAEEMRSPT